MTLNSHSIKSWIPSFLSCKFVQTMDSSNGPDYEFDISILTHVEDVKFKFCFFSVESKIKKISKVNIYHKLTFLFHTICTFIPVTLQKQNQIFKNWFIFSPKTYVIKKLTKIFRLFWKWYIQTLSMQTLL